MYRYYQISTKSKWRVIAESRDVEAKALKAGAIKLTILSLSEDITEDTDLEQVKYSGKFFVDIDDKHDLCNAAKSTKELVQKLINKDVSTTDIEVFASGGKGFHVLVNSKVFYSGRAVASLPSIYKEMALTMYVEGMDLQVYSQGKGTSWRIENVQREEGSYRVRIDLKTLDNLCSDPELYKKVTAQPSTLQEDKTPAVKSIAMEVLYEQAKRASKSSNSKHQGVASEHITKTLKGEIPNCIISAREGKFKSDSNYNLDALTVATFLSRSGATQEECNSIATRMADKTHSTTYSSARDRKTHLLGLIKYVSSSNKWQWSCSLITSKLSENPCQGCAMADTGKEVQEGTSMISDLGLHQEYGGYFRQGDKVDTRVSTFVIKKQVQIIGPCVDKPEILEVKGVLCSITSVTGEEVHKLIPESSWKSKSNFITMIEGVSGAVFFGNDMDVQKIKFLVFNDGEDMVTLTEVIAAGIHFDKNHGTKVPVYVEPNLSVNSLGVVGTHTLERRIANPPHLKDITINDTNIEAAGLALRKYLKINHPNQIAKMLGFLSACHFKTQITEVTNQFPLLGVWGASGAGKSKLMGVSMWLSGAGGSNSDSSFSLPNGTKFPLIETITTTTTVPRVLEEFNKAKMTATMFSYTHEILKAAFDGFAVTRGALGGGGGSNNNTVNARTIYSTVSSPIVYMCEQPIDSAPLRQRTIPIHMTSGNRDTYTDGFFAIQETQQDLEVVAKCLALQSLGTSVQKVKDTLCKTDYKEYVLLENRNKLGLQIVATGLDFLQQTLKSYNFSDETQKEVNNFIVEYHNQVGEVVNEISEVSSKTEIDSVIETMGIIAYLTKSNATNEKLIEGEHYHVAGDSLLFDLVVCHSIYKTYKSKESGRNSIIIDTPTQMHTLIRAEPYFISSDTLPSEVGVQGNRRLTQLSIPILTRRGIDTTLF